MTFVSNFIKYRELLINLAVKEIKVKYKSAILGLLWALIVPITMMLVFLFIFSTIFNIKELTAVYLLAALFPWIFLNLSISSGVCCFVDNANIIKKVYFPRELIPVSITLSNLFNFVLSILILIILSLASGYKIGFSILYLPVVIIMQALFVSGIVLILSSLFVYYRDIKYFTEILLTIWFYLTPIFYDQKLIRGYSETLFKLFLLNPMTGLIVMYRDILMYGSFPSIYLTGFTFFLCVVFFIAGMALNSKLSGFYADYV
ncbi:MAG TPA: ABC transporter permease [bacterium]|nr:ABC transporter permease [bacterium]